MISIGHRGAKGYEPENTLLSFQKALDLKVDMIELDVHVCKSGELVVIHDNKTNRTTGEKGIVCKKTLTELKKLNAGKNEKIPTLKEVLDLINCRAKLNVELKGKGTAKPVFNLIENYVKTTSWNYEDFFISSFDLSLLEEFSRLTSKVKIGVLYDKCPKNFISFAKKVNAYSINPNLDFVDKNFVDLCHKNGFKVFVFTVNEKKDIERLESFGIEGVFSDFPDRVK